MTVSELRFKTIYQSAQATCEYFVGRDWYTGDGIPAEREAGDYIVKAMLDDELEAVTTYRRSLPNFDTLSA